MINNNHSLEKSLSLELKYVCVKSFEVFLTIFGHVSYRLQNFLEYCLLFKSFKSVANGSFCEIIWRLLFNLQHNFT